MDSIYNELSRLSTYKWFNVLTIIAFAYLLNLTLNLIISMVVRRSVRHEKYSSHSERSKRIKTILSITHPVVRIAVVVIMILLIIAQFIENVGALFAGASAVGVALGLGIQPLLKDFMAGVYIIVGNMYRVGDVVTIAGVSGTVESITLRQTILRNISGDVHHVPNGIIDVTTNKTMGFSIVEMIIGVDYKTDITKLEKVINRVGTDMLNDADLQSKIIEVPEFVRINNFGPYSVDVLIMGKVKPGEQWAIGGVLKRQIKLAFDKNNIQIPYPQSVIHQVKYGKK